MQEKYRNMTPEECAARFKRNKIIYFIIYILVLFAIGTLFLKRFFFILPLKYADPESAEIYNGLYNSIFSLFLIRVVVCLLLMIIVEAMQELFFYGIFLTLCDPEKYINAEEILFRQNFFFRRYTGYARTRKMKLGLAYYSLEDYDTAWNYLKNIIPANPEKCSNIRILTAFTSYFYDSGDKEKAAIYRARLEQIKASSKKKNLQLDLTLDSLKIKEALDNKQFDEAKELIRKYINNHRVSQLSRMHHQYYLGLIAYETNDYPEAIYRFKTSLENCSKLPFARDAKAKLEEICKSYHV